MIIKASVFCVGIVASLGLLTSKVFLILYILSGGQFTAVTFPINGYLPPLIDFYCFPL